MQLEMFNLLDLSLEKLDEDYDKYEFVEKELSNLFNIYLNKYDDVFIGINSRIKSPLSLKEKMLRNEFYLNFDGVDEVFENLHDLIGVSIQCRFISDEDKIMKLLYDFFIKQNNGIFKCRSNKNVFLHLDTPQPKLQRNGYPIYRIDGHYLLNEETINFELQIKSLIHNFWSDVEHQIVYKNNKMVFFDSFMSDILSSIRDNLEVVEGQLQTVSEQIKKRSVDRTNIGMDEDGFKHFLSTTINDIYTTKIQDSIDVSTDFRKCSGILAQYIYLKHFISSKDTKMAMIEYFEMFDLLKNQDIDFTKEVKLENRFINENVFINKLGGFLSTVMNKDFKWHVFFVMLFLIEPANNYNDMESFIKIISSLIMLPSYVDTKLSKFTEEETTLIYNKIMEIVVIEMIKYGKINIVYEENIYKVNKLCKGLVDSIAYQYDSYDLVVQNSKHYSERLALKIRTEVFN
jgi:ppGpp synthetase/RelA/SpoT-type nucleotidyltranferase